MPAWKIRHLLPAVGVLPRSLDSDSTSGLVGSTIGFTSGLAAHGADVELWGIAHPAARTIAYTLNGVRLSGISPTRIGKFWKIDLRYQLAVLRRAGYSHSVDFLHVHNLPTLLLAPRATHRVLHLHMALGSSSIVERRLLQRCQGVVCASSYLARSFQANHPQYTGLLRVIFNGVNPHLYADPRPGQALRNQLGIPRGRIVVLYSGQISPLKGVDQLITAISLLPPSQRPILLIAGSSTLWRSIDNTGSDEPSPFETELRKRSSSLPVHWLGKLPAQQVPHAILAADIVCSPSVVDEGLGTINLEAAAAGRPVVATAVGGVPEVVHDGITGLLIPRSNPEALAQALRTLSQNHTLRTQLGSEAQNHVVSWEEVTVQLLTFYREIAAMYKRKHPEGAPS